MKTRKPLSSWPLSSWYHPIVAGVCPFCGGSWSAGTGHDAGLTFAVSVHSMPQCNKFVVLSPDEFLAAIRKAGQS